MRPLALSQYWQPGTRYSLGTENRSKMKCATWVSIVKLSTVLEYSCLSGPDFGRPESHPTGEVASDQNDQSILTLPYCIGHSTSYNAQSAPTAPCNSSNAAWYVFLLFHVTLFFFGSNRTTGLSPRLMVPPVATATCFQNHAASVFVYKVHASPAFPARAVRPTRCT
jgi:hypothetical protein